ncbi:MAG: hypothetical protein GY772_20800 [bacterium]|jgi:hypothetical protein|nr:hypothetical protein [bacterium]MDP7300300.1 hypothetical protein [Myxococcota bacterium]HJO24321.1 hypothetical protein [Myxococcota bacterium]
MLLPENDWRAVIRLVNLLVGDGAKSQPGGSSGRELAKDRCVAPQESRRAELIVWNRPRFGRSTQKIERRSHEDIPVSSTKKAAKKYPQIRVKITLETQSRTRGGFCERVETLCQGP